MGAVHPAPRSVAAGGRERAPARSQGPLRTCIGCGARAEQRELFRLRLADGEVVDDPARSGGRGAWLHPAPECLERAARRRAFGRAFRATDVRADLRVLRELLTKNTRKD
jgi:predicted RNA-binding protein YlxR (DUF448 family)